MIMVRSNRHSLPPWLTFVFDDVGCLLFAHTGNWYGRYFVKKLKNVSCEYNRLNGWNSTLQAAWYIRRVRIIWFLLTKPTIWSLILSSTQNIVRACSMFYPYEGYRSVTPLDAARVNRTISHNHSVHWYYIILIKGRDYIKHDINTCLLYTSPSPRD